MTLIFAHPVLSALTLLIGALGVVFVMGERWDRNHRDDYTETTDDPPF